MTLRFYNTLSADFEEFKSIEDGVVKMYTCGPTVYDYAHIGNFRAYVFEDLLRRYLKFKGYAVVHVMNLTDVDDKTIKNAQEKGLDLAEYTAPYIKAFFEDLDALNIERAEYYPRATEHIPEMIDMIKTLQEKNIAYESDGSIYYRISRFADYGKLSKKRIDQNVSGTRVDHDEYERDDVRDFVLWKKARDDEPSWDSPFGFGRPGWHIECSAMSMKYLGAQFDIHTGGEDNIFPHHENEIAQSEGASGKKFVRFWLHCKFLLVENEKMSKSKGNFYTLRDLIKKGFSPLAIRYVLLTHNYRHPLNFTLLGIEQAQVALTRIRDFVSRIKAYRAPAAASGECEPLVNEFQRAFTSALDDDLNIARAMAALFDFMSAVNKCLDRNQISPKGKQDIIASIDRVDSVLGILKDLDPGVPEDIQKRADEREAARKAKDFTRADEIRDRLLEDGWSIEDTPSGPRVKPR
jgi:cysteinyl-tRNA synthetase